MPHKSSVPISGSSSALAVGLACLPDGTLLLYEFGISSFTLTLGKQNPITMGATLDDGSVVPSLPRLYQGGFLHPS